MVRRLPTFVSQARFGSVLVLALGAATSLGGCAGDQLGGQDIETGDDGCVVRSREPLERDEVSPLGFTADSVLDFTIGEYETPMTWKTPETEVEIGLEPDDGDSSLHLAVSDEITDVEFVDLEPAESEDGMEAALDRAVECRDYIQVKTNVRVDAENGAFADDLPLVLRIDQMFHAIGRVELEPGALAGSFDLAVVEPLPEGIEEASLEDVELVLNFTPGYVSGGVVSGLEVRGEGGDSAAVSFGGLVVGDFPIEPHACEGNDFQPGSGNPVASDSSFVDSVRDVLAETDELALAWNGSGAPDELGITFEIAAACATNFAGGYVSEGDVSGSLDLAIRAPVTGAEGEALGEWLIDGRAEFAASGALTRVELFHQAYLADTTPTADFEARWGLTGLDFGDADEGGLELNLVWTPSEPLAGDVRVHAIELPATCEPSEPVENPDGSTSVDGCPGITSEVIATASVSTSGE